MQEIGVVPQGMTPISISIISVRRCKTEIWSQK